MKFDPELMRSILIDAEEIPAGEAVGGFEYEDREQAEVNRHTQILLDEDFLEGKWMGDHQNFPCAFRVTDLTYRGHQFLANAKNDTLWKKALNTIRQSGKTLSIGVIQKVLEELATS